MSEGNIPVKKGGEERCEGEYTAPVFAEEVGPFDGVDSNDVLRVRVVAPCDLHAGYKLLIKTSDGEVFDVVIPDEDVHRGQEFEATKLQPKPIESHFSDGLCGCLHRVPARTTGFGWRVAVMPLGH
jgi:hypothetical protein